MTKRLFSALALAALLVLSAAPCRAQQDSVSAGSRRSGTTATALGILLPGAGHFYAREPGRGALFMGATGLLFMYGFSDGRCKRPYESVETCELDKDQTVAAAALVGSLVVYAFSAWDAHRAAHRTNRRRGLVVGAWQASPDMAIRADEGFRGYVGIRLVTARR